MDLDKVSPIGRKQQHYWLLLIFQLVIIGYVRQKTVVTCNPLLTFPWVTHQMVSSWIWRSLANPHRLRHHLIDFIDTTDICKRFHNIISLKMSFFMKQSYMADFILFLTLKTNDRASLKDAIISKSECSTANETMKAHLYISSLNQSSDTLIS